MMLQTEADERELVEAARRNPERFADLYERHFESVYAYIATRVRNRNEAQDLTADVFHSALAQIGGYEWRGVPFAAWLFRIASNAIADHFRRKSRQQEVSETEGATDPVVIENVERRAGLYRLVNALPADQRKVLLMRFSEEKSVREIAQEMRRTEGAIKQLQFRAVRTLRAQMGNTNG